jgi:hypothetical protein
MLGTWVRWRCWSAVLILATGCWLTEKEIKPKPHPEEYIVPPNDARFTNPPELPKDAPKDNNPKKPLSDPGAPPPTRGGTGFGAGRGY